MHPKNYLRKIVDNGGQLRRQKNNQGVGKDTHYISETTTRLSTYPLDFEPTYKTFNLHAIPKSDRAYRKIT